MLLGLGLAMLMLEGASRQLGHRLSADLRHLEGLDEAADRLARPGTGDGRLLIVGNSLAREGVDTGWVKRRFSEVEMFVPDGSSVVEWSWGLRKYFLSAGARPDEIWVLTGRAHLLDQPLPPEKLGGYYIGVDDLAAAARAQPDTEGACRLLLGWASRLFAIRDRVRPIVGYRYLPGFAEAWPAVAAPKVARVDGGNASPAGSPDADVTASLRRLLDGAEMIAAPVTVVWVPLPDAYEPPSPVLGTLEARGTRWIDLSRLEGLDGDRFPDGYHLDREGAEIFTSALLEATK